MHRRRFLQLSVASGVAVLTAPRVGLLASPTDRGNPAFRHGVASGDPLPDRVVIWTRVTPGPDAFPGSGRGGPATVRWEVTTDEGFRSVVRHGTARTDAGADHTVKVDVDGLSPATTYFYRFLFRDDVSPTGRTRTAPRADAEVPSLRFGVVSCANYEGGYFSAYRHLADRDDLDFVLHLGDYLYEYGVGEYGAGLADRRHDPAHEMVTLEDYRRRHARYKADPDLQRLHARYPFVVTWDDHEVTNDAWRDGAENHDPATEGDYRARRDAAHRAYFEWMPIRLPDPAGDPSRIYRRLQFGALADLHMLDLRQYRDEQVGSMADPAVASAERTITGDSQMAWLKAGLAERSARWRLVGNPLMIAPVVFPPLPAATGAALAQLTGTRSDGVPYNVDQWDGYQADRRELLEHISSAAVDNVVFLTGDIHSSWACDLPLDPGTYPLSPSVAVELVGTSATSDNLDEITGSPPRTTSIAVEEAIKASNRHVKLVELDSHGYSVVDVTAERLQMDWWYISDRTDPAATQRFGQAFEVEAGANRATPAAGPIAARPTSTRS